MPRKAKPWFRVGRGEWFGYVSGQQKALGVTDRADEAGAIAALEALLNSLKNKASPEKQGEPAFDWNARVEAFIAYKMTRDVAPRTLADYRNHLTFFLAYFGTLAPSELVVRDGPAGEPRAPRIEASACVPTWGENTRRNYLAAVETFLRWAGHPVSIEKPGRESAGAGMVISEAVYNQALGNARGDLRPLLCFLWNTGCRPSEATKLTAADVDWSAGTITLRQHKTRRRGRGKARIIFLSPAALEVLTQQRESHPTGLLFPNRAGTAWRDKALAQAVWRVAQRIGHRVTAYGCRHSYCTRALEKGVPDVQVAALMGHGSTRMIHKHYAHIDQNAKLLKEAAAKIDGAA